MKLLRVAVLCAALILIFQNAGTAQRGHRRGGPGGPGFLLVHPEVQRELKLSDTQVEQLKTLGQEMSSKAQETFRGVQNLPREERFRRFRAFNQEWEKRIGEILNERQSDRLAQLHLQLQGQRALSRRDVADKLRLSTDQRQKVDAALDAEREAMKEAFRGFSGGTMTQGERDRIDQIFREVRAQTDARLNAVLTDSQRRQWQSMLGAPFKFPDFRRGPKPG